MSKGLEQPVDSHLYHSVASRQISFILREAFLQIGSFRKGD